MYTAPHFGADECDIAGQRHRFGESCIQTLPGNHDTKAVRPDQTHAAATRQDCLFQLHAYGATFPEPSRNDDCTFYPSLRALADHVRNGDRRRGDCREIDRPGHVPDPGKGLQAKYAGPPWIDRVNPSGKRPEVFHQRTVDTVRTLGANDFGI
jgi:hypothetical protein